MLRCALVLLVVITVGAELSAAEAEQAPAQVRLHATALSVRGASRVPHGLFGTHNAPLTPERIAEWGVAHNRVIHQVPSGVPIMPGAKAWPAGIESVVECYFDRYIPAKQLTNPDDWQQQLRELGARFGAAATGSDVQLRVEFWNEPYLNWGNKPGVNYDPRWYDQDRAVVDGPVFIMGQAEPTEFLRWREGMWWEVTAGPDDFMAYVNLGNLWHRYSKLKPGEEYAHQGRTLRAYKTLVPYDPGQPSWWSRPQNREWYLAMLRAFGTALKAANPEVELAGGWGCPMQMQGWRLWEVLGKPSIDNSIDLIDAWHEHHYGGDPRTTVASYLTIGAYGERVHGKRLQFWNTEAGPNYDPQRPDRYRSGDERWYEERYDDAKARKAHLAAAYIQRDILDCIRWAPELAVTRADHHTHHEPGSVLGLRLLRQLRGELLLIESDDPSVWAVASMPSADSVTVVVWNDHRDERSVALDLSALPAQWAVARLHEGDTGLDLHTSEPG
ncbi:MAG: hypothetical protein PF961_13405 [Planctomycetota bacterium]|nr:hypothetical protein [Planctomycetota bacterium]